MTTRKPRGVLITFDEDSQSFNICTVPRTSADALMSQALVNPWPLADSNFRLDDEVARSIGSLVFRLLAASQPGLTPMITVTKHADAQDTPPCD